MPDFVSSIPISENGDAVNYAMINNAASLLYIVNLGVICQNVFMSVRRVLISGLAGVGFGPEEAPFNTVCEVAVVVKSVLDDVKISGYPRHLGPRHACVYT